MKLSLSYAYLIIIIAHFDWSYKIVFRLSVSGTFSFKVIVCVNYSFFFFDSSEMDRRVDHEHWVSDIYTLKGLKILILARRYIVEFASDF